MLNSDFGLDSFDREMQSNGFGGIFTDLNLFNHHGRGHGTGGRTKKLPLGPLGRGLRLNYEEEEPPIHPAFEVVNRYMESDMPTASSSDSFTKLKPQKPVTKSSSCIDNLIASWNGNESSDLSPDTVEHANILKAQKESNGDLIREELRKNLCDYEKKTTGFFDNYFSYHNIGTEWVKNISKDVSNKENGFGTLIPEVLNQDPSNSGYQQPPNRVQESGFKLDDDVEFPALSNSPSKPHTPKPAAVKPSPTPPKPGGGKRYYVHDIDLGNDHDDDSEDNWFKSSDEEETYLALPNPAEDQCNTLVDNREESELRTALWISSLDEGAASEETTEMETNCSVVIRNLPEHVSKEKILETLGVYGEVKSLFFCDFQEGMKFCVVEMMDTTQADEVVDMFQEIQMFGNPPDKPITTVYYNKAF